MEEIRESDKRSAEKDERLPLKFTPVSQRKRLVCIEYPGYVNDLSKALKTLGGEKQVDRILKDPLKRVGVHFRPNDPYCKPCYGERFPVTDLLMKVKRKKRKGNGMGPETEDFQYECEVLGVIDTVVKFKTPADFQYLAPQVPDLLDNLHGSEMLEIETELHIPPPMYCRMDHPFDYHYRPDPVSKDGTKTVESRIGTSSRKPRPTHVISCHFNTPAVPTTPKEEAVKEMRRFENKGLDVAQRLFNTRPIWSRRALTYHLRETDTKLKALLPCVAYYWIGGPWRTLWVKFGYDPRKNPAAKMYGVAIDMLRFALSHDTIGGCVAF